MRKRRCPEFCLHVDSEPCSKDLQEVDNGDYRGKMVSKGSYELGVITIIFKGLSAILFLYLKEI